MGRLKPEPRLKEIAAAIAKHPQGIGISDIANSLPLQPAINRRTLQSQLKMLLDDGRIIKKGAKRWTKYYPPSPAAKTPQATALPLSSEALQVQEYVRQPITVRRPMGYDHSFLEDYRPNHSALLDDQQRRHLSAAGALPSAEVPAGTFAQQILNRLLIDLSWNSSRLEGNTYSLLET